MNELALFAGAGGGILGGHLLGWRTVCAVERDAYAAQVLAQRQNDGSLPAFPIWSDVQSFDGKPWRGIVDVVSGGFPCQDISSAGKGAGITGERSGMWSHMARIVGEVRPRIVFVENSPALLTRGLGTVLSDLAALGYDCRWTVLGAADVGAPHQRDRFWLVAYAASRRNIGHDESPGVSFQLICGGKTRLESASMADPDCLRELQPQGCKRNERGRLGDCGEKVPDTNSAQRQRGRAPFGVRAQLSDIGDPCWWASEPDVGRMAHGVAARVDRLKAIGNGQVPLCAAEAFRLLTQQTKE